MGGTEFLTMKYWHIITALLLAGAVFFHFCMEGYGYDYIAATLVFIAGLIILFHFGNKTLIRIVSVFVSLGLLYFFAVEFLIVSNSTTDKLPGRKYLIVLGAQVRGTVPSLSLQHRLEGALDYMNANPDCIAVVSGGKGTGETVSEAQCMKTWLTERGIAVERIIEEDQSTSTQENLRNSWAIIQELGGGPDDVAVLSSNYHLYRAKCMAKVIGMNPAGVRGSFGYPIYTLGMFIREAFGMTHFWVFGY